MSEIHIARLPAATKNLRDRDSFSKVRLYWRATYTNMDRLCQREIIHYIRRTKEPLQGLSANLRPYLPFYPKTYTITTRMNAEILHLLLVSTLAAMYALAISCLCQRRLSLRAYILWGLFALVIPALGPFSTILARPGKFAKHNGHKGRQRKVI